MAANEISEKLLNELMERVENLERFCDKMALESNMKDSSWISAAVMAFDIRTHLLHHKNQNIECNETKKV